MNEIWDQLKGQDRVRDILRRASENPAGSYLFVGPPGVGKSEAAVTFAAAILCEQSCGSCSVCRRVRAGIHPDVAVFGPEGLTWPVELIREMAASAALTPLVAERRVLIVEEADRIAERSQNALLKAIEEPNPSVTWILVASALDPFLPTVVSRCEVVEFAPLPEEAMASALEDAGLAGEELDLVLRTARGDLRRASALTSDPEARLLRSLALEAAIGSLDGQAALGFSDRVREAAARRRKTLEEDQAAQLEELNDTLTAAARKRLTEKMKRELRRGEIELFLEFLVWLASAYRDLAAASAGAGAESLTHPDHGKEVLSAAKAAPTRFWLEMSSAALAAQLAVAENANPALQVESVLLASALQSGSAGVAQSAEQTTRNG